jgi:hypothetical protein
MGRIGRVIKAVIGPILLFLIFTISIPLIICLTVGYALFEERFFDAVFSPKTFFKVWKSNIRAAWKSR